jgi:hypothetical protein
VHKIFFQAPLGYFFKFLWGFKRSEKSGKRLFGIVSKKWLGMRVKPAN